MFYLIKSIFFFSCHHNLHVLQYNCFIMYEWQKYTLLLLLAHPTVIELEGSDKKIHIHLQHQFQDIQWLTNDLPMTYTNVITYLLCCSCCSIHSHCFSALGSDSGPSGWAPTRSSVLPHKMIVSIMSTSTVWWVEGMVNSSL